MKKVCVIGLTGDSIFLKVDRFHRPEETIVAESFHREPGGKGYNQVCMLNALGAPCTFISVIGNDQSGLNCLEYLKQQAIEHVFSIIEGATSALAVILTNKYGQNQVTVMPGASLLMSDKIIEQNQDIIKACEYLLIQLELPPNVVKKAVTIANKHHVKVVLNPAPFKNYMLELLPYIDVLTPNEEEFSHIDLELCYNIHVIVTKGAQGADYFYQGKKEYFSAPIINDVVDTTGAGDIFNATLVYFLLKGDKIQTAIEQALIYASTSVKTNYVLTTIEKFKNMEEL